MKGSNIPDGEGKQGDMQLMRGIISVTMQEMKLSSKNGSPQRGERKLPKSEKKKIENVQGYLKKKYHIKKYILRQAMSIYLAVSR